MTSINGGDQTTEPPADRRPPWPWISLAVVGIVAAVGMGVWGANLSSDNDELTKQVAALKATVAAQETEASAAAEQAEQDVTAASDMLRDVAKQLGITEDALSLTGTKLEQTESQLQAQSSSAQEALDAASKQLADSQNSVDSQSARADAAEAQLQLSQQCLGAVVGILDAAYSSADPVSALGDVPSELAKIAPSCPLSK